MPDLRRNDVHVRGTGDQAIVFAPGFGSDQYIWRHIAPAFEREFKTVLFDHVGCGTSQLPAFSPAKYRTVEAYSQDLLELCHKLQLRNAVLVGHSFGAMVGALASIESPGTFDQLVFISPNACFINQDDYVGGYSQTDVEEMLYFIGADYRAWSLRMAPLLVDNPDRPALTDEVVDGLARQDPVTAAEFARVALFSDTRVALKEVRANTLVLHNRHDVMVPPTASQFVHKSIPASRLVQLEGRGHFPHLSAPRETVTAISRFLRESSQGKRSRRLSRGGLELLKNGTQILGLGGPLERHPEPFDPESALDALLARMGELWMHLGRYDMYALTLQRLLYPEGAVELGKYSLQSRGGDIRSRLAPLSSELLRHFEETERDLQSILQRAQPSARHGAAIAGLNTLQMNAQYPVGLLTRTWFDQLNTSEERWEQETESVERDVLRMVALCFRVSHCALGVQRLLQQEGNLQQRTLHDKPGGKSSTD